MRTCGKIKAVELDGCDSGQCDLIFPGFKVFPQTLRKHFYKTEQQKQEKGKKKRLPRHAVTIMFSSPYYIVCTKTYFFRQKYFSCFLLFGSWLKLKSSFLKGAGMREVLACDFQSKFSSNL